MEKPISQQLVNLLLVLGTAGCVAIGQVLWKLAAQKNLAGESLSLATLGTTLLSPWFLVGCVAYAFGVIFWVIQLSRLPLATSFALTTGSVFLVALIADAMLFSTPLSALRIAGGAVVLCGIALATWS